MINIALAGDHALNLHALASLFSSLLDIRITSISRNVRTLRDSIGSSGGGSYPRIVVLDVNFELRPAIEVIRFIKKAHSDISVIVLGLTRDEKAITKLFRTGADHYLPKNVDPAVLEHSIRNAATASLPTETPADPPAVNASQRPGPQGDAPLPAVTEMEYRYFRLAISDVSNEDIRHRLNICESSYVRLVGQAYRRFNVRSRDGLAMALFKHRWMVRDDL